MKTKRIIDILDSSIGDPSKGLPQDVFLFISRITPLINVDLLIKNEKNDTLLTWRDDGFCSPSWHIPGGIIRFKETIADRIHAVAKSELGAKVEFNKTPLATNEVIHRERKIRGHFISLLFQCSLVTPPDESLECQSDLPRPDEWMWHSTCPANIIPVHEMYRKYV